VLLTILLWWKAVSPLYQQHSLSPCGAWTFASDLPTLSYGDMSLGQGNFRHMYLFQVCQLNIRPLHATYRILQWASRELKFYIVKDLTDDEGEWCTQSK
jgi:hypothetical protein